MNDRDRCDHEYEKSRTPDDPNHVRSLFLTSNVTSECESTGIEDEIDDAEEERGKWVVKDEVFETSLS